MPFWNSLNLPGLPELLAVALGGLIGSVARFMTSHYMALWLGTTFPWGTLVVNVVGSLLIGFVMAIVTNKPGAIDPAVRLLLTSGFAGGFTTFSALAYETLALAQKGEPTMALLNIGGNLLLGFLAALVGILLARFI